MLTLRFAGQIQILIAMKSFPMFHTQVNILTYYLFLDTWYGAKIKYEYMIKWYLYKNFKEN